ncbi:solute carrier family 49 member A3 isoform X2 [Corythoichthys intestinalis]|uniref:solute carrier family 49 member A3 isoform X2 n=1 Tax=Corythoichthys intestinalis TaxID=161448 RepID=UPI0025A63480|nr:solute carrier family 49 member A3 isoform X2 [Corythoichthys intestinalis]
MENGEVEQNDVSNDSSPLVADSSPNEELKKLLQFKVYKRRWLVLLVLCLLNCSNATLWLTFAPVADQSAEYLKVTLANINWLSVVYMVVSIPLSVGTTWMLDTVGLRATIVLGAWLNMLGAVMRICGGPPDDFKIPYELVMAGQTLAALAQPLIIFTPTKMAALWFPDHQRATANMMGSMANPLGLLVANVVSPAIADKASQIPRLLLAYAVPACFICFLATVGIRSSAPPTPPSASAEFSTSEPFMKGVKLDFAGLCGALFIVFGIVGAALLGLYVDKTKRFIEAIKINMSLSALAGIAFSVLCLMQRQNVAVAIVCSLFGFFGYSIYPVAMELSVECSYPVGEASTAGLIFISGQIFSICYTVLLQSVATPLAESPRSTCGVAPQSWKVSMMVLAALTTFFTALFVIVFHTRYKRLEAEKDVTCRRKRDYGSCAPAGPDPASINA